MDQAFVAYFTQMFTTSNPNFEFIDFALQDITRKVTSSMNDQLLAPFTHCEIERAIKQMYPIKAPGLDWFSCSILPELLERGS